MSATTITNVPGAQRASGSGGWFSNLLERMVEVQAARVRRQVYTQLRGFNDETLRDLGFNAEEIKQLRHGAYVALPVYR